MLDDRDYMRRSPRGPENKVQTGMSCVYALIAINAVAFLVTMGSRQETVYRFWLSVDGLKDGMFWQILTAMFMHGSIGHIFFNMWGLYIFGGIVAPRLGGRGFLALYLSAGLIGNLLWLACAWNGQPAVLCGASGAVMGVTAAAAVMAPDIPMLLLFIPFPIKLRTMAVVFFALDVLMEISGGQSGVAHLAHIGGFLSGYLFLKLFFRREILWDPLTAWTNKRRVNAARNSRQDDGASSASGWTYRRGPEQGSDYGPNFSSDSNYGFNGTRVSQRELDYLLDKISRTGINSLTPQELARLKQAREEMRR